MDEELERGSTAPTGHLPAGQIPQDWNTSLADPAPDPAAANGTAGGTAEPPAPAHLAGKQQPEWREPAGMPAVQRTRTGAFGEKLTALDKITREFQAVMASIDADGLSDPEIIALTQAVEQTSRPVDAARVTTATVVGYRSARGRGRESLAWRMGASCDSDLMSRLTGTSAAEVPVNRDIKSLSHDAPIRQASDSRPRPRAER